MGVDMTTIDGLLKRVYSSGSIENMQNMEAETFPKLPKSARKPKGDGFYFPVNVEGNQRGQGSQNELEALRTPASQTPIQGRVRPKVFTHTIRYSGLSMEMAKGDEDSFADNVTFQVDEGIKDSTKELNAQVFRSGLGQIAQVNGDVTASTDLIFDNGCPTHFRVGQYIDVINAGVKEIDSIKISAIDIENATLTLASVQTCTDDMWVYRENTADNAPADGKELAGLPMVVDDGSIAAAYENINRTTYPNWDGFTIAGGGASISNDLLQRGESRVKVLAGRKVKKIISNTSQMRKYLDIVTPLKRFVDKKKMDSGVEEVPTWNGKEWVEDTDCPFDTLYMYDPDYFEKFEIYALKLDDNGGGTIKWDPGYDGFVSYLKYYGNTGSTNPRTMLAYTGLATPTF